MGEQVSAIRSTQENVKNNITNTLVDKSNIEIKDKVTKPGISEEKKGLQLINNKDTIGVAPVSQDRTASMLNLKKEAEAPILEEPRTGFNRLTEAKNSNKRIQEEQSKEALISDATIPNGIKKRMKRALDEYAKVGSKDSSVVSVSDVCVIEAIDKLSDASIEAVKDGIVEEIEIIALEQGIDAGELKKIIHEELDDIKDKNKDKRAPQTDMDQSEFLASITAGFCAAHQAMTESILLEIDDFGACQRLCTDMQEACSLMSKSTIEKQKDNCTKIAEAEEAASRSGAILDAVGTAVTVGLTILSVVLFLFTGGLSSLLAGLAAAVKTVATVGVKAAVKIGVKAAIEVIKHTVKQVIQGIISTVKNASLSVAKTVSSAAGKISKDGVVQSVKYAAVSSGRSLSSSVREAIASLPSTPAATLNFLSKNCGSLIVAAGVGSPTAIKGCYELKHAEKLQLLAHNQKVIGESTAEAEKMKCFSLFTRNLLNRETDNTKKATESSCSVVDTYAEITEGLRDAAQSVKGR